VILFKRNPWHFAAPKNRNVDTLVFTLVFSARTIARRRVFPTASSAVSGVDCARTRFARPILSCPRTERYETAWWRLQILKTQQHDNEDGVVSALRRRSRCFEKPEGKKKEKKKERLKSHNDRVVVGNVTARTKHNPFVPATWAFSDNVRYPINCLLLCLINKRFLLFTTHAFIYERVSSEFKTSTL